MISKNDDILDFFFRAVHGNTVLFLPDIDLIETRLLALNYARQISILSSFYNMNGQRNTLVYKIVENYID
jgi:hypothetical protein